MTLEAGTAKKEEPWAVFRNSISLAGVIVSLIIIVFVPCVLKVCSVAFCHQRCVCCEDSDDEEYNYNNTVVNSQVRCDLKYFLL